MLEIHRDLETHELLSFCEVRPVEGADAYRVPLAAPGEEVLVIEGKTMADMERRLWELAPGDGLTPPGRVFFGSWEEVEVKRPATPPGGLVEEVLREQLATAKDLGMKDQEKILRATLDRRRAKLEEAMTEVVSAAAEAVARTAEGSDDG